jgi:uncharacterized protein YecE (DUF72 family)
MNPETFAKWRDSVPDGFKFALKASRFCTTRRVLPDAAESIEKFLGQGLTGLGDRLGPILWQMAHTKKFDASEFEDFLALLPATRDGIALRHAIEPRHDSFKCPQFVDLARKAGVAIVMAEHETYPQIADLTADFVYARLQCAKEVEPAGYSPEALDNWAGVARAWAAGESPSGLDYVCETEPQAKPRDAFIFFISGDKVRNPLAAESLIGRLA